MDKNNLKGRFHLTNEDAFDEDVKNNLEKTYILNPVILESLDLVMEEDNDFENIFYIDQTPGLVKYLIQFKDKTAIYIEYFGNKFTIRSNRDAEYISNHFSKK